MVCWSHSGNSGKWPPTQVVRTKLWIVMMCVHIGNVHGTVYSNYVSIWHQWRTLYFHIPKCTKITVKMAEWFSEGKVVPAEGQMPWQKYTRAISTPPPPPKFECNNFYEPVLWTSRVWWVFVSFLKAPCNDIYWHYYTDNVHGQQALHLSWLRGIRGMRHVAWTLSTKETNWIGSTQLYSKYSYVREITLKRENAYSMPRRLQSKYYLITHAFLCNQSRFMTV